MHLLSLSLRSLSVHVLALHLGFVVMAMPLSAVDHPKTESMAHLEARGRQGQWNTYEAPSESSRKLDTVELDVVINKGYQDSPLQNRPVHFRFGKTGTMKAQVDHRNNPEQLFQFKSEDKRIRKEPTEVVVVLGWFQDIKKAAPLLQHYGGLNLKAKSELDLYDKLLHEIHTGNLPKGITFKRVTVDPWPLLFLAKTEPNAFKEKYDVDSEDWLSAYETLEEQQAQRPGRMLTDEPGSSRQMQPAPGSEPGSSESQQKQPAQGSSSTTPMGSTRSMLSVKEMAGQKRPPEGSESDAANPVPDGKRVMLSLNEMAGISSGLESGSSGSHQMQPAQGSSATKPKGGTGNSMLSVNEMAGIPEPGPSQQK